MDPWSKVDYSRHIREASMAMEKLPEVNPSFGRVPGQHLLAAPILKRRRRWRNKEGIGKKGSLPEGFRTGVNIGGRGRQGGGTTLGRATRAPGALVGPLWPPLDYSGSLRC